MITVRTMTGAFLFNNNDVLMLKRSNDKKIAPGLWSCIGGHVELDEQAFPEEYCFREIAEETGIMKNEINYLKLRYILLRLKDNELNQHFIYFGNASTRKIISCDEGELHWIKSSEALSLQMPLSLKLMYEHYLHSTNFDCIWTGTYGDGKMIWSPLF